MDRYPLLPAAIFLFIAALVVFWLARRQHLSTGLPGGRLIYTDTQQWTRVEKPLYCPELNLTGKPDYLFDQDGMIIPVEVKSSRKVSAPYDAHINQLAAYCILVERSYGIRPSHGILRYPDQTFAIDFTPVLESRVFAMVRAMQAVSRGDQLNRSHDSPERCVHCGYRDICDQALRI